MVTMCTWDIGVGLSRDGQENNQKPQTDCHERPKPADRVPMRVKMMMRQIGNQDGYDGYWACSGNGFG
jgi:hypothetical protein